MTLVTAPAGLARKSVGTSSLWFFGVSASSPMTVLAGGIIATYAGTGVLGVPLSFILLCLALALATVGYVAMSRYVPHAATFYALLARGLGPVWGVAGAMIALIAYNCIQISLYGLFGATLASLAGGTWWVWAIVAWALVALLGILHVGVNAKVLAVVLVLELGMILLLDLTAFGNPATGSISLEPLLPSSLFVDGVGGVLALGVAAFIGYESAPVYGEEARGPRTVGRATFASLAFLGAFYALSAWALATATGPEAVVDTARDPEGGLPFVILDIHYGSAVSYLALILLITSVFAAMLSFHNSVSRYVFALSRERVLPAALGRIGTGRRGGAPIGGSLVQSAIAAIVVAIFVVLAADPIVVLFTWLSTIAAIGVMLLMFVTCVAVIMFFRRGGGSSESAWQRFGAPALGGVVMFAVLVITVANVGSLLGAEPGSSITWMLPAFVGLAVALGLTWGLVLRQVRPDIYRGIGHGRPKPLAVLDHQLAELDV
ncbi:MAG TPA: APC family permease [Pilimelia sp.]|nr:APC family permease [Pilimelia sp.]